MLYFVTLHTRVGKLEENALLTKIYSTYNYLHSRENTKGTRGYHHMERLVATGASGGGGSNTSKDATEARIALECNQRIKRWHTCILALFIQLLLFRSPCRHMHQPYALIHLLGDGINIR